MNPVKTYSSCILKERLSASSTLKERLNVEKLGKAPKKEDSERPSSGKIRYVDFSFERR